MLRQLLQKQPLIPSEFFWIVYSYEVLLLILNYLAFAKRLNPRKFGLFSCIKQNISSMVYGKIELTETISQSTKKEMYTYDNT